MNTSGLLLTFGRDAQLLETRALVLEKAGYRVQQTTSLPEMERALTQATFNLVILCHSISGVECSSALSTIHRQTPPPPCLVLTTGQSACADSLSENLLNPMEGPAKLIAKVKHLLNDKQVSIPEQKSGNGANVTLFQGEVKWFNLASGYSPLHHSDTALPGFSAVQETGYPHRATDAMALRENRQAKYKL